MADIRINDLPLESSPTASEFVAIDGSTTRKSTIQNVVNAGAPVATQTKAEAGTDNNDRMTALTTKQAIDYNSVPLSRNVVAGSGLTGGGQLSSNITLNVGAGVGITVTADAVGLSSETSSRLIPSGGGINEVLAKNSNSNYDLKWTTAGAGDMLKSTYDPSNLASNVFNGYPFSTRSSIKSLNPSITNVAYLNATDSMGYFSWLSGNFSSQVSADTQEDTYISSTVTPSSSGAWVKNLAVKTGGFFSDLTPKARVNRLADRVFVGDAVLHKGTTDLGDSGTYAFTAGVDYLIDGAQMASMHSFGGVGGFFATKDSNQYSVRGDSVTTWVSGGAATSGQKYGWNGIVYNCTTSGTFGSIPPTHTSGTLANGTAQLQFGYYLNLTAVGLSFLLDHYLNDGRGAWGMYGEVVHNSGAGTSYLAELVVKNKGSNVNCDPYNEQPAGASIGLWMVAGGDVNTGASVNPSTAGIIFKKNDNTWNKGIIFEDESLTRTSGLADAIGLAKGHKISWWSAAGDKSASIRSDSNAVSFEKMIVFKDTSVAVEILDRPSLFNFQMASGYDGISFESGAQNAVSADHGMVRIIPGLLSSNCSINIVPKGGGVVGFGSRVASGDAAINGYVFVRDISTGSLIKLATIA